MPDFKTENYIKIRFMKKKLNETPKRIEGMQSLRRLLKGLLLDQMHSTIWKTKKMKKKLLHHGRPCSKLSFRKISYIQMSKIKMIKNSDNLCKNAVRKSKSSKSDLQKAENLITNAFLTRWGAGSLTKGLWGLSCKRNTQRRQKKKKIKF